MELFSSFVNCEKAGSNANYAESHSVLLYAFSDIP